MSVLPKIDFVKTVYRKLNNYFQISYGEGEFTIHDFNFSDFCKTYKFNSLTTYNTLQILDRTSIISLSKQYQKQSTVQIIVSNSILFKYLEKHIKLAVILKSILRTYGGIFDYPTKINSILISDKSGVSEEVVIETLIQLEKDKILDLKLKTTDAQVTFLVPREDDKTINRISKIIQQQNDIKHKQVTSVIDYINNDKECKTKQLLSYFGETNLSDCGVCSVCIKKKSTSLEIKPNTIDVISNLLKDGELSSREIVKLTQLKELELTKTLKLMLELNKIEITQQNTYKLR